MNNEEEYLTQFAGEEVAKWELAGYPEIHGGKPSSVLWNTREDAVRALETCFPLLQYDPVNRPTYYLYPRRVIVNNE